MPREKKLTSREISAFCAQISMILKSGIPVEEGLAIMQGEMENEEGKKIVSGLLETVGRGEPLHAALLQSGRFPKYMVDRVAVSYTHLDVYKRQVVYRREEFPLHLDEMSGWDELLGILRLPARPRRERRHPRFRLRAGRRGVFPPDRLRGPGADGESRRAAKRDIII